VRLVALLLTLLGPALASAATWESGTLAQAMHKARATHRWILVDIYATWCGPCHEMDDQVYPQPEVQKALGGFVALRRDGEKDEGLTLVERYHTVGFPTLLVLDENGVEIDRLMGFVEASRLVASLAGFRRGEGTLQALETRLRSTPSDEALRAEVARRHAMRGDPTAPTELRQVVDHDPSNQAKRASSALLVLGKYFFLRGKHDSAHAVEVLEELRRRYPGSAEAEEAPYQLATALVAGGKVAAARVELDGWLLAGPNDADRHNDYAWFCFKNKLWIPRGILVAKEGLRLDPKHAELKDTLRQLTATERTTQ